MLIEIRGNGSCLLNAVCAVKFIITQDYKISNLLYFFSGFDNKNDLSTKIRYDNKLNLDITMYIKSTYMLVEQNLIPLSDEIIKLYSQKMQFKADYDMLEFKKNMDQENYNFDQFGQVISTILDCVIILLNISVSTYELYGKFPTGERASVSLGDITLEFINEKIMSGVWNIIFIINLGNRHYNSLIPTMGSREDIKRINIEKYNSIKEQIIWN